MSKTYLLLTVLCGVFPAGYGVPTATSCSYPTSIKHGRVSVNGIIDLEEQQASHGSELRFSCNTHYELKGKSKVFCQFGQWSDEFPTCVQCDKVTLDVVNFEFGGRPADVGEIPWHAGIYDKHMIPYLQVCGGSLVSTTMVISAAHCFWNEATDTLNPASQYAVALGKIYRPWNDRRDTSKQQFDVQDIKVTPRYRGSANMFHEDIALVLLSTPAVYQRNVRPVYVDFDAIFDRSQLDSGKKGKIAGWGQTGPSGKPSPVLRVLELPTVTIADCITKTPVSYLPYITSDKFCAGYWNGSKALCRGDSGGGLVFAEAEGDSVRYYLRGVASTAPSSNDLCNAQTVTTFTRISRHEQFIKAHLQLLIFIRLHHAI